MEENIITFVNNLFIHNPGEPEKMTLSDAVYNLCAWIADGVELPEGITPAKLMIHWNRSVDARNRYKALDETDGDEI